MNVSLGDVSCAARYLVRFAEPNRAEKCEALFELARRARHHLRLTGSVHPLYGDGSLSAIALRSGPAPLPTNLDQETIEAMLLVLAHAKEQAPPRVERAHKRSLSHM